MADVQATYVRFPKELHQRTLVQAEREDRSMASLIRVAVRQYLERAEANGG